MFRRGVDQMAFQILAVENSRLVKQGFLCVLCYSSPEAHGGSL
jgi:hypothetical protein